MLRKNLKSNLPKISVVIPSYNKVQFIEETLKSILDQNYHNLEVIIQDGGSTDGTLDIIKKYAKMYPEILNWESKKDKGQADAINKGMKKAMGDILTYLNADDIYENSAFKYVATAYLNNSNATWFAGRGRVINKRGIEIAKPVTSYKNFFLSQNNYSLLLITNYLIQPSVFLTRPALDKIKKFLDVDGIVMEYDAWLKLGRIEMPVIIDKVISSFRMSANNISSNSYGITLNKDQEIAEKYSNNHLVLFLHKLNNLGRRVVVQSLR